MWLNKPEGIARQRGSILIYAGDKDKTQTCSTGINERRIGTVLPEFNHNSKNKATCRELNYAFDAQEEYPFNSITIAFVQQLYS